MNENTINTLLSYDILLTIDHDEIQVFIYQLIKKNRLLLKNFHNNFFINFTDNLQSLLKMMTISIICQNLLHKNDFNNYFWDNCFNTINSYFNEIKANRDFFNYIKIIIKKKNISEDILLFCYKFLEYGIENCMLNPKLNHNGFCKYYDNLIYYEKIFNKNIYNGVEIKLSEENIKILSSVSIYKNKIKNKKLLMNFELIKSFSIKDNEYFIKQYNETIIINFINILIYRYDYSKLINNDNNYYKIINKNLMLSFDNLLPLKILNEELNKMTPTIININQSLKIIKPFNLIKSFLSLISLFETLFNISFIKTINKNFPNSTSFNILDKDNQEILGSIIVDIKFYEKSNKNLLPKCIPFQLNKNNKIIILFANLKPFITIYEIILLSNELFKCLCYLFSTADLPFLNEVNYIYDYYILWAKIIEYFILDESFLKELFIVQKKNLDNINLIKLCYYNNIIFKLKQKIIYIALHKFFHSNGDYINELSTKMKNINTIKKNSNNDYDESDSYNSHASYKKNINDIINYFFKSISVCKKKYLNSDMDFFFDIDLITNCVYIKETLQYNNIFIDIVAYNLFYSNKNNISDFFIDLKKNVLSKSVIYHKYNNYNSMPKFNYDPTDFILYINSINK